MLSHMPKLWGETIEAHRRTVSDAILETTAALVSKQGLASVTMSQIAEETGVGRATLYKYFPDVDAILVAWHERHVTRHLEHLTLVRDRSSDPSEQLEAVLEAYAVIMYERSREHAAGEHSAGHHGTGHQRAHGASDVAGLVHRREHVAGVQDRLTDFLRDVLAKAARNGTIRKDVPPEELARYCLQALAAASSLESNAAVRRLVAVTMAGLRPQGA